MQFSQFPLDSNLIRGLDAAGYTECTPVQEATLKSVLDAKKDVYAQSQTGTGKTAAFLVAALSHLLTLEKGSQQFILILAPTRELAVQIEREAKLLAKYLNLSMVAIYGGVSYGKQIAELARKPKLIVATPGRLIDFSNQGLITLKNAAVLVVDEADRLFDMGFQNDLIKILKALPAPKDRLSLLFSATLNNKVGQLAWEHMNNPESIVIKSEFLAVEGITQRLYHVSRAEKMILLLALMKKEQPTSAIIFSNTKAGAGQISKRLTAAGYRCALIEGNIPQKKRLQIIQDMKLGKINFLAATDIASRGLHIPNLELVINFDLPDDPENYIHRIGRTARGSQKTGKAINFACERFVYNLSSIERLIKKKIPVAIIDEALQSVVKETLAEEATRPREKVVLHPRADHRESDHPRRHQNSRPSGSRSHKGHSNASRSQEDRGENTAPQGQRRNSSNHSNAGAARSPHPPRPAKSSYSSNATPASQPRKSSESSAPPHANSKRSGPKANHSQNSHHRAGATSHSKPRPQQHSTKASERSHEDDSKKSGSVVNFLSKIFTKS